eukprot:scaffold3801_cov124-Isochrysis_galbana.AAC.2
MRAVVRHRRPALQLISGLFCQEPRTIRSAKGGLYTWGSAHSRSECAVHPVVPAVTRAVLSVPLASSRLCERVLRHVQASTAAPLYACPVKLVCSRDRSFSIRAERKPKESPFGGAGCVCTTPWGRHKGGREKEPTPRVPREVDQHAGAFSHPFRGREATCEHVQAMWGQQGPTSHQPPDNLLILPHIRSLTQHFGGRAGSFCPALAPGDQSACAYSVAPAQDAQLVSSRLWAIRRAQELCARARQQTGWAMR